jgi:hypothetical protein
MHRATSIISHTRAFPHAWSMARSTADSYWITSTARRAPLANKRNLSLIGLVLIGSWGRKVAWPARWVRMYYMMTLFHNQNRKKKREKRTYVDTFNSGLFFIHDGSVDVAPEDTGYGSLVFALSRFAEVDHAPANTCVCVSGGLDW